MNTSIPEKLILLATFALATLGCACEAQSNGCSYGRDLYDAATTRVLAGSCQGCIGGQWQAWDTRTSFVLQCLVSDIPSGRDGAPANTPGSCSTDDGGVYSAGAVRADGNQCWRCVKSKWTEVDAATWCGIARSVDEQRIAPSPALPHDLEGQVSEIIPGLTVIFTLRREEFTALEAMVDASFRNQERLADGAWAVAKFVDGYDLMLRRADQWQEQLSLLRKWRAQSPNSAALALLEARYWIAYAKLALGTDPSMKLPPGARQIAHKRAEIARSILLASKRFADANPLWYCEMLAVATLERWPYPKRRSLFDEAIKAYAGFDPIYVAMANSFAPSWGGSLATYHQFVHAAVAKTWQSEGETLFATLYWNLSSVEPNKDPFRELGIPWDSMKAGFASLLERYPDSEWNLHNFAAFACRAQDPATFKSLLPKLSETAVGRMHGAWRDAYTFEYCRGLYSKAS